MVLVTANFERNLDAIQGWLTSTSGFDELADRLFETVVPNLERFPGLGYDLLSRRPGSLEGEAASQDLIHRLEPGDCLREYISGDYLLLYRHRANDAYLLAIKHHLQLSFDLRAHWLP